MSEYLNPPLWQNIPPPVDPKLVSDLRAALRGPCFLHDEEFIGGNYEELERRLLEQMDEFFGKVKR